MKVYFSKWRFGSYTLRQKRRRYSGRIYKHNLIMEMSGESIDVSDYTY
jgi:hypothetical protein